MRALVMVLCVAALTAAQPAQSEISAVSLETLILSSDQIVIATVTRVTESSAVSGTVLHATATVAKTLKGSPLRTIRFVAYPSSPERMDSTEEANEGETILLFLYKRESPEFGLMNFGRGRMPLRKHGGKTYATLWASDIILPTGAPITPEPDPRFTFIVSVDFGYLEQQIAQTAGEHRSRAP
ncbi:MAG: hypothetical protein ACREVI_17105 [Steroidobacteraceae bacterium]